MIKFITIAISITMSFLTEIYTEIETEFDGDVKRSHKAALYTLMNYIEASDSGSGINQKELEDRFFHQKEYVTIVQKLLSHSVVEKSNENGTYKLNPEARQFISPLFADLMSIVYKPEKKVNSSDPSLNLLYNCRSQLFSS